MALDLHRSIFAFIAACAVVPATGQWWMRGWGSPADDRIEAMEPMPGGDVVVVGSFSGFFDLQDTLLVTQGVTDAFVARVNGGGTVVWARRIGGSGVDRALDVAVDANGNVAIVGQFAGTMQVGGTTLASNNGSLDGFAALCDANGNFQWAAAMGSAQNADRASAVALAPDGSVLIGGDFSHTALFGGSSLTSAFDNLLNAPGIDVFLARYNPAGVFQWVRQGSATLEEECVGVACDNTGAAYFTGRFSDAIAFQQTHPNTLDDAIFLVKFDANGNEVWFRRVCGAITNQVADVEWKANALFVAGHQTGNTVFFGPVNTPVGSNYANSAFILKVDASGTLADQWTYGSDNLIGTVDLCIGDTALVIGGWFECILTQGADENGAGLFMSIGVRNNWVAELGLGSMQHGFVQQFGSHYPGGMTAISLADDEVITAAGVYRGDLLVASIDTLFDAMPELSVEAANLDATVCGDTAYGDFIGLDSIALFDAFIMKALPRERSIYDIFQRQADTCDLSTLPMGRVGPDLNTIMVGDTGFACGNSGFLSGFPFSGHVAPFHGTNGPWVHGVWQDGYPGSGHSADTLEHLWFDGSTDNGCYTFSDSIWGSSWPFPPSPTITDDQGVNVNCTACAPLILCLPTTPELTATLPDSSLYFEWVLPGGATSNDTVVIANASGIYTATLTNAFGCVGGASIEVTLQPVSPLDSLTALIQFIFPEDADNNDTIVKCSGGSVDGNVFHTIYENGVAITSDPAGIAALDSVFSGGGGFQTTHALPISINPGSASATITGEGWYVWEYHYYLSNFPCDSDLFVFVARDSIYVDTIFTVYANVYISGGIRICPGDTLELTAVTSDPGALAWTGAGIVSDTTAAVVLVTEPGYYAVELTPLDTGECIYGSADSHLITLDPAPFISMIPTSGLICPGDSVMIVSSLNGAFQWYGPTGPIGSGSNTFYASEPGTYFVVLTSLIGCGLASNTVEVVNYSALHKRLPATGALQWRFRCAERERPRRSRAGAVVATVER
ncbi:MAG: hypothetical protein ABI599_12225 [Flavobacteriales bacterium]